MKRGTKVAVCYDGKWGRRVPGVVTGTRNGHHIRVRFVPFLSETNEEVEGWFRVCHPRRWRRQAKYFAGWINYDGAFMSQLIASFGSCTPPAGDWYSVTKWKE